MDPAISLAENIIFVNKKDRKKISGETFQQEWQARGLGEPRHFRASSGGKSWRFLSQQAHRSGRATH